MQSEERTESSNNLQHILQASRIFSVCVRWAEDRIPIIIELLAINHLIIISQKFMSPFHRIIHINILVRCLIVRKLIFSHNKNNIQHILFPQVSCAENCRKRCEKNHNSWIYLQNQRKIQICKRQEKLRKHKKCVLSCLYDINSPTVYTLIRLLCVYVHFFLLDSMRCI